MPALPLAVLVVDDSDVLRTVVSHYLDDESDLQVIALGRQRRRGRRARPAGCAPTSSCSTTTCPAAPVCSVLPELRACSPCARIVVFSAAPDIRQDALLLGADEFVGKESPFHEVADVLRACADAGQAPTASANASRDARVPARARVQAVEPADEVLRQARAARPSRRPPPRAAAARARSTSLSPSAPAVPSSTCSARGCSGARRHAASGS